MTTELIAIYEKLNAHFGPQHWWPAQTPFEVMIGAILTQNTNWLNVEKALDNLKKKRVLKPERMLSLSVTKLAALIRPAGYYNIKAKRLNNFLQYFLTDYQAKIKKMSRRHTQTLRRQLLSVNGIGPETADSILLYALNKPVFVVDAYTKRILERHKIIQEKADYHSIQNLFMQNLENNVKLFNQYHALFVKLAKEFCLKNKPRCNLCPLRS